jgi:high-affinity Fe2+/Pb2+ permease
MHKTYELILCFLSGIAVDYSTHKINNVIYTIYKLAVVLIFFYILLKDAFK